MDCPDVLFIPERSRGTARIRSWWPAEVMRAHGLDVRCAVEDDPDSGADELRAPMDIPTMLREIRPKVAIVHQTATWYKAELVLRLRLNGAKVIVSEDDAFWLWPHGGTTERMIIDGNRVAAQKMGTDLNSVTIKAAQTADRVVVTTDHLARLFGAWNPDVRIIPNYLPAWVGEVEPPANWRNPGVPTIGFRGTVGAHREDLTWIRLVAREMLYGCCLVEIGGGGSVAEMLRWKGPRIDFGFTHDPRLLYSRMVACDAAFVPLDPTLEWNAAKSWLGGLEWATVGVPCVATATEDHVKLFNRASVPHLAEGPEEMRDKVRVIVENPERVRHRYIVGSSLEARASEWIDLVGDLL